MIHLMMHFPREAKLAGPVSYRWMYPFERYLCILMFIKKNKEICVMLSHDKKIIFDLIPFLLI